MWLGTAFVCGSRQEQSAHSLSMRRLSMRRSYTANPDLMQSTPPPCSLSCCCHLAAVTLLLSPAGAIAPDAALLLSSVLYCGCLIVACLMEPSRLRSIVAFSATATLLYTPLFKKLTAVKNATVATVIALAPIAGALAAGAVSGNALAILGDCIQTMTSGRSCSTGCQLYQWLLRVSARF